MEENAPNDLESARVLIDQLRKENANLRAKKPQEKIKIPTKILKLVFGKYCPDIANKASNTLWINLPDESKKELMAKLFIELQSSNIPVADIENVPRRLRNFYNSLRISHKKKESTETRRLARKASHLHVNNHRLRNDAVKRAISENRLDPNDADEIKEFRKNVKIQKVADIESPPASDHKEGRMAAQQKKIHALKRGSERRKNLYHRMQEELLGISCIAPVQPSSPCPTTSTPTTSTPLREISNVPSGQEPYCLPEQNVATDDHDYGSFREWLKKPSYLSYPWEEIPEMPFQKLKLVLEQDEFVPNFGITDGLLLQQLFPGCSVKAQMMTALVESVTISINNTRNEQYATTLMPFRLPSIQVSKEGKCQFAESVWKQIESQAKETQSWSNQIILTPVIKTVRQEGLKISYWTLTAAMIEDGKNKFVFFDPYGDVEEEDEIKLRSYHRHVTGQNGEWTAVSQSSFEKAINVKLPKAAVLLDSGIIVFLYALVLVGDIFIPAEIDVGDVRLWILNKIIKGSVFSRINLIDDDNEPQFP